VLIRRVTRGQSGSTDNAPSVAAAAGSAEEPVKSAVAAPSEDSEPGRPGTEDWAVTVQPKPDEVAGYTNPASVKPGGTFSLFVSSSAATVTATAYRIGGYTGGRGRQIWQATVTGRVQPAAEMTGTTRTVVAAWKPSTQISTSGWPAGFYLIKLVAATGGSGRCPSWCAPAPPQAGSLWFSR